MLWKRIKQSKGLGACRSDPCSYGGWSRKTSVRRCLSKDLQEVRGSSLQRSDGIVLQISVEMARNMLPVVMYTGARHS